MFSTYLGGSGFEQARAVAVDCDGYVEVAGTTDSTDFPVVAPLQTGLNGTSDSFVARLDSASHAVVFATFFGGSSDDGAWSLATDPWDNVYVGGNTSSTDYPLAASLRGGLLGTFDATVSVLDPSGSRLIFSTCVGGSFTETAEGIAADGAGAIVIAGPTSSSADFPTVNAFQATSGGQTDAFVARIDGVAIAGAVIGGVGNTLMAVRDRPGNAVVFNWKDIPAAVSYNVHTDTIKTGPLTAVAGTATSGSPGLSLPWPVGQLLLYKVTPLHCGFEGPI